MKHDKDEKKLKDLPLAKILVLSQNYPLKSRKDFCETCRQTV